jgi:small subunit ribosomal protein S17
MPKRVLQGVVVSDKQDKTVVVKVERRFTHPVLKKTVRRSKNYHAHDESNSAKVGQTVSIVESRPYSKLKTWKLVEAGVAEDGGEEEGGIVAAVTDAVGSVVDRVKSAVGLS